MIADDMATDGGQELVGVCIQDGSSGWSTRVVDENPEGAYLIDMGSNHLGELIGLIKVSDDSTVAGTTEARQCGVEIGFTSSTERDAGSEVSE
jgi:hypothetical protein